MNSSQRDLRDELRRKMIGQRDGTDPPQFRTDWISDKEWQFLSRIKSPWQNRHLLTQLGFEWLERIGRRVLGTEHSLIKALRR